MKAHTVAILEVRDGFPVIFASDTFNHKIFYEQRQEHMFGQESFKFQLYRRKKGITRTACLSPAYSGATLEYL